MFSAQVSLATALQKVYEGAGPKDVTSAIKDLQDALSEASKANADFGQSGTKAMYALGAAMGKGQVSISRIARTIDEMARKRWPAATAAVFGFADGLLSSFKFVTNVLRTTLSLAGSIASSFINIGLNILAMPFRSLEGLIALSNKLVALMQEIATATEEVRKQFGDLTTGPAKGILNAAKQVGGEFSKLGLGGYAIFGNLAERMRFVNQTATEMGAAFEPFQNEFAETSGALLLMQKGLGLTGEEMKGVAMRAKAFGTSMTSQLRVVTKFSQSFGKAFGVSSKFISRDMGIMMKDVKNFGNLSAKELAKTSVFARKLGLDVKDLTGLVDKFETFESAADSASMLSQAFGVQTDALKLMKMQNPADQLDYLRKQFLATGQTAENMSRQELKYLASMSGISEEAARAAFSQKNLGTSMADLEKQGKISEKRQLTTAQAVGQLTSSIERIIKPFRTFTGFLSDFAKGFFRGIGMGDPFRTMLTSIHNALKNTYDVGMKVGEMFVQMFPGVKALTTGMSGLFSVEEGGKFRKLITDVHAVFKQFFVTVGSGLGKEAVGELWTNLSNTFKQFFKDGSGELYGPLLSIATSVGDILSGIVQVVIDEGTSLIDQFVAFLNNPQGFKVEGDGIVSKLLGPIIETLTDGQNVAKLKNSFTALISKMWEIAKPGLETILKEVGPWVVGIMLGSALVKASISFAATKLIGWIGSSLLASSTAGAAGGAGAAATTAAGAGLGSAIMSGIGAVLASPVTWVVAFGAAAAAAAHGVDKFTDKLDEKFSETETKVGASAAGIAQAFSLGLLSDDSATKFGNTMAAGISGAIDAVTASSGEMAGGQLESVIDANINAFTSLGDVIRATFSGDMNTFSDSLDKFGSSMATLGSSAITDGIPLLMNLRLGIITDSLTGLGEAGTWLVDTLGELITLGGDVSRWAGSLFKDFGEWLSVIPIIGPLFDIIGTACAAFFEILGLGFQWVGEKIDQFAGWLSSLGPKITETLNAVWEGIKFDLNETIDWIKNAFSETVGKVLSSDFVTGLDKGMREFADKAKARIEEGVTSVKNFLGISSPSTVFEGFGEEMVNGMIGGISGFGSKIVDTLKDIIPNPVSKMLDIATGMFENSPLGLAVDTFVAPSTEALKGLIEEANALNDVMTNISPINIKAKLKEFADRLGLKGEQFQIKSDKLNIIINLNVDIEADKLVSVLSEHGIVSTQA